MCSFVPHLICTSRTSWQAGKEVLQMDVSRRMRESQIFAFLQDGITSEMQDSHPVIPCSILRSLVPPQGMGVRLSVVCY